MIRVTCSVTELEEDAEVISVGDRVERLAERAAWDYYGGELDEVVWHFDQYAPLRAETPWTITGTVASIHAIYVRLARRAGDEASFSPEPGSVHLESLTTTLGTRDPGREREQFELTKHHPPAGVTAWYGPPSLQPRVGDEALTGWLFVLEEESVHVTEPWPV